MLDSDALAARIQDRMGPGPADLRTPRNPPPRVPDHELIARIGEGSYGDVLAGAERHGSAPSHQGALAS